MVAPPGRFSTPRILAVWRISRAETGFLLPAFAAFWLTFGPFLAALAKLFGLAFTGATRGFCGASGAFMLAFGLAPSAAAGAAWRQWQA